MKKNQSLFDASEVNSIKYNFLNNGKLIEDKDQKIFQHLCIDQRNSPKTPNHILNVILRYVK